MESESVESQKAPNEEKKLTITVFNRIIDVFLEFCDDSTIHGPKNMGKSTSYVGLRIFWALCTTPSTIYCIYSCVQLFQTYYS